MQHNCQYPLSRPVLAIDTSDDSTHILLALPGQKFFLWPKAAINDRDGLLDAASRLLQQAHICSPVPIVIARGDALVNSSDHAIESWMHAWKNALSSHDGIPWQTAAHKECSSAEPLQPLCSCMLCFDPIAASIMAFLSDEKLHARCWTEGVTAIWAGKKFTYAFLIHKAKVCATSIHHASTSLKAFTGAVKQLQLGWLTDDQVRHYGDIGCVTINFPPDSEGFKAIWILGQGCEKYSGIGRMASLPFYQGYERCLGMIDGYIRSALP